MSFVDDIDGNSSGVSRDAWRVTYEISPIVLTGGIAPAGTDGLPIISLTESQNYDLGILSASDNVDTDSFFAYYRPTGQVSLIKNQVATWPFVNQTVAANAIIQDALTVSLKMYCPTRTTYAQKTAVMSALQSSLVQHIALGGLFNVATMAFPYTGCILTDLIDISQEGETNQPQWAWQWNFIQPLTSLAQLQAAQNSAMQRITNQTPQGGDPPGSQQPNALTVPAANMPAGTSVPGPQPSVSTQPVATTSAPGTATLGVGAGQ